MHLYKGKRKFELREKIIISCIVCSLILSGCSIFKYNETDNGTQNTADAEESQKGQVTALTGDAITAAAEKVTPAVVGITTTKLNNDLYSQNKKVEGVGSGVIVSSKGYILTNNHVAGNAETLTISLYDGRDVKGKTVWTDSVLDLAIVKINANNLTAATLGDSKTVKVGQDAIAIGNPLGLTFQRTVTAGIISAVNRTIEVEQDVYMEDLIQTDASINPGNSGGPLINNRGEVVGINTVKVITAEGMGFAVPVNVAKPVISKVAEDSNYSAPSIGLQSFDKELGKIFDFTVEKGVYVYDSCEDGCAHKAGIRKGDTILSINDKPVNTSIELKEAINAVGAGNTVKLRIKNGHGEKDVYIKLDEQKK